MEVLELLHMDKDGSVTFSKEEYQAIVKDFKDLKQTYRDLKETNNQQAIELAILRPLVKQLQGQVIDLTQTISDNQGLLTAARLHLTTSENDLASRTIEARIAEVIAVISIVGNGIQLIKSAR
jgi:uncharacterized protein YlxW (UPF0749 family)